MLLASYRQFWCLWVWAAHRQVPAGRSGQLAPSSLGPWLGLELSPRAAFSAACLLPLPQRGVHPPSEASHITSLCPSDSAEDSAQMTASLPLI